MIIDYDLFCKINIFLGLFDLKISNDSLNSNNYKMKIFDENDIAMGYLDCVNNKLFGMSVAGDNRLTFSVEKNDHDDGYYFNFKVDDIDNVNNNLMGEVEVCTNRLDSSNIIKGQFEFYYKYYNYLCFKFSSLSNGFNIAYYKNDEFADFHSNDFRYEKRNKILLNIKYHDSSILYDKNMMYLDETSAFGFINNVRKENMYEEYLKIINTHCYSYFCLLQKLKNDINAYYDNLFNNISLTLDNKLKESLLNTNKKNITAYYLHK